MVYQDWDLIARDMLERQRQITELNVSNPVTGIFLMWRNGRYFGALIEAAPDYSHEIAYLSKTSKPIPQDLYFAVKRLDSDRLEAIADNELDLEGRHHFLRRVENRLTILTPEQLQYIKDHPEDIVEI
jgi:hypothetical protein